MAVQPTAGEQEQTSARIAVDDVKKFAGKQNRENL
jgi:hypothetical protein